MCVFLIISFAKLIIFYLIKINILISVCIIIETLWGLLKLFIYINIFKTTFIEYVKPGLEQRNDKIGLFAGLGFIISALSYLIIYAVLTKFFVKQNTQHVVLLKKLLPSLFYAFKKNFKFYVIWLITSFPIRVQKIIGAWLRAVNINSSNKNLEVFQPFAQHLLNTIRNLNIVYSCNEFQLNGFERVGGLLQVIRENRAAAQVLYDYAVTRGLILEQPNPNNLNQLTSEEFWEGFEWRAYTEPGIRPTDYTAGSAEELLKNGIVNKLTTAYRHSMLGPSFYQKAAYAKSYQAFKEDQDRLLLAMHGAYVERYVHYAAVPGVWGLSHPTLLNTFESKSGRRFAVMLTHRAPNLRNDYFIDDKYILDDRSILTWEIVKCGSVGAIPYISPVRLGGSTSIIFPIQNPLNPNECTIALGAKGLDKNYFHMSAEEMRDVTTEVGQESSMELNFKKYHQTVFMHELMRWRFDLALEIHAAKQAGVSVLDGYSIRFINPDLEEQYEDIEKNIFDFIETHNSDPNFLYYILGRQRGLSEELWGVGGLSDNSNPY